LIQLVAFFELEALERVRARAAHATLRSPITTTIDREKVERQKLIDVQAEPVRLQQQNVNKWQPPLPQSAEQLNTRIPLWLKPSSPSIVKTNLCLSALETPQAVHIVLETVRILGSVKEDRTLLAELEVKIHRCHIVVSILVHH
jgi:hypothetical protein